MRGCTCLQPVVLSKRQLHPVIHVVKDSENRASLSKRLPPNVFGWYGGYIRAIGLPPYHVCFGFTFYIINSVVFAFVFSAIRLSLYQQNSGCNNSVGITQEINQFFPLCAYFSMLRDPANARIMRFAKKGDEVAAITTLEKNTQKSLQNNTLKVAPLKASQRAI